MTDISDPQMGELQPQMNIKGYTVQTQNKQDLVNQHKDTEERLLRHIEKLQDLLITDSRWSSIAKTHFEQGFMALNRAVFQPQRIKLTEDISND